MDNKKIGKLIADLRRKQGLTQQDLGDKVGVGFRAVSKWERGLTLPDISIINELSKILGISSDELLTGTINKENKSKEKRKLSNKIKVTITIITSIIIVLTSVLMYYNNKTYVYDIASIDRYDYFVEGQATFKNNKMTLIINKIDFKDENLNSTKIKNYEYDIGCNNNFIFRYGYIFGIDETERRMTIKEFSKEFNTSYIGKIDVSRKYILSNNIKLTIRFIKENDEEIVKELELILTIKNSTFS